MRLMHRSIKNRVSTSLFLSLDRVGVHVLPKHFYTPVSDYQWLRHNKEAWTKPWDMRGVDWDPDGQLGWLAECCGEHLDEVAGLHLFERLQAAGLGFGYGPIESQVLHCFLRRYAPRRIVEVGSGVSTACMLEAVGRNVAEGRPASEITCIEPFPKKQLERVEGVRHLRCPVQTIDRCVFDQLEAGDLLFIDCSHAVKTGSDVVTLYLNVIPRLRPGVFIHIHDINLPYLYCRETMTTFFEWQETAMLAALLTGNQRLTVKASLSALHYTRQDALRRILPDYRPQQSEQGLSRPDDDSEFHFPSSIYLQMG
jgi:predicted O-methyltransferase YrrM